MILKFNVKYSSDDGDDDAVTCMQVGPTLSQCSQFHCGAANQQG